MPERQVMPAVESGPRPLLSFAEARKGKPPVHLADLNVDGRKKWAVEQGLPAFRADQLSRHYFERHTSDPEDMSDLPAAKRSQIAAEFLPALLTPVRDMRADGGRTIKSLVRLYDGAMVESVLMRYPSRTTLCISSQAGCGMACPFCATGQAGLTRNLSTAEIVEQVRLGMLAAEGGKLEGGPTKLTNVVFMGMGEPLANWKRVIAAVHRIVDDPPAGFGLSARNVTVSTVGMVPLIDKLADEGLAVTLAVSLHAPDDELRDPLIPINSRFKVARLLDSARNYFEKTGRRVSIEYALIKDMNDHPWRARLLAKELNARGRGWVHVNPIPLNPTPGSIWTASTPQAQSVFVQTLVDAGIPTTIRDTRGSEIDGACGQLAAEVAASSSRAAKAAAAAEKVVAVKDAEEVVLVKGAEPVKGAALGASAKEAEGVAPGANSASQASATPQAATKGTEGAASVNGAEPVEDAEPVKGTGSPASVGPHAPARNAASQASAETLAPSEPHAPSKHPQSHTNTESRTNNPSHTSAKHAESHAQVPASSTTAEEV